MNATLLFEMCSPIPGTGLKIVPARGCGMCGAMVLSLEQAFVGGVRMFAFRCAASACLRFVAPHQDSQLSCTPRAIAASARFHNFLTQDNHSRVVCKESAQAKLRLETV
eukprot:1307020-Rhodomonas_salina.2